MRKKNAPSRNIAPEHALVIIIAIIMTSCGQQEEQQVQVFPALVSSDSPDITTETPTYRHPFRDALTTDGIIFHDVRDSPTGQRYAMGELADTDPEGNEHLTSGIFTLSRTPIPQGELDELERQGRRGPSRRTVHAIAVLSDSLRARMDEMSELDTIRLSISVHKPSTYRPLTIGMEEAIALGEVQSEEDRERVRAQLIEIQKQDVNLAIDPVVEYIGSIGGRILDRGSVTFGLEAELTKTQIQNLSQFPSIRSLELPGNISENNLYGYDISQGSQMETTTTGPNSVQFIDDGYLGKKAYSSGIRIGVLEHKALYEEHVGFLDANGSSRILKMMNCHTISGVEDCETVSAFGTPTGDHGTAVSGIVLGDITQEQDPTCTSTPCRRARSGFAREARLMYWRADGNTKIDDAIDHIIADSSPPYVVNMSIDNDQDPTCDGTDLLSLDVNLMYEAGIPLIFAAGNDAHSSTSVCNIDAPGSAIGAFVVGAHTNSSDTGETSARSGDIALSSSRGGTTTNGRGRTIVDLTAVGCFSYAFDINGSYSAGNCGTSYAAPVVTASSALLMDFYKDKVSNWLEFNPGKLYAQLLLMGDMEEDVSTGQPVSNFDNLWGAGRLKMRRLDTYGMDSYHGWGSFETCISDGENYDLVLNGGNALSSDVDIIKVVAFWYDNRHQNGDAIDNIDISLLHKNSNNQWIFTSSLGGGAYPEAMSNSIYDEKERIYFEYNGSGIINTTYAIRIHGSDVTSNSTGCGSNSIRVHIAYLYEDSDRDDGNGPDSAIEVENP